jgi:hypothetical protein
VNSAIQYTPDLIDATDLLAPELRSGRATWDDRGNSIWEWQTQPGVFSRDVSDEQLERLQAPQLRIVETPSPRLVPRHR